MQTIVELCRIIKPLTTIVFSVKLNSFLQNRVWLGIKHFFKSQRQCTGNIELYSVYLSSNFISCPERLRDVIRSTLRKDESALCIYLIIYL